ncbi:EamA domain-containing membrane protein RarD [Plasticicumulans lactativorans]|uniref:EamA domain-containing membrane protein RarD n=1 Tax=Plasticicumulans lactativorans TaxID=1133106 RepID=A0A4R2LPM7_9GAMM|nr:EamA family transporter [Plasticicumulans lactativorans]TCO81475.1 EamA domain-containing membrane protein RarD [Plasticicumulans lactativorans]
MPVTPRLRATLIGATAILLWALLALLTTLAGGLPPFQLLAITFAIGGGLGLAVLARREGLGALRQPWPVWALGVGGLFGYHALYFIALAKAPPVDANLINYLWPTLIVLFSALLPGERLRARHVAGSLCGLAGAWLIVAGGDTRLRLEYLPGYLAALGCALTWAAYSVANRRYAHTPTGVVAGICLAVALLGLLSHLAFERTVVPSAGQWLAALVMGLGPLGAAFFVWDHGTKHGDIQLLGVFSYAAPLLSTLLLILAGHAEPRWQVGAACALIVGGALLASWRPRATAA